MASLSSAVRALAKVRTSRVTLETLTDRVGDRRTSSTYLHSVLPPLLARMAVSLGDDAPASLAGVPAMSELVDWYGASAERLAAAPPPPEWAEWRTRPSATFLERERTFDDAIEKVLKEGQRVRETLFDAMEASGWLHKAPSASEEVDAFLGDFYARRLTLRLLLGQHRACRRADRGEAGDYLWATFDTLDANADGVLEADELRRARSLYAAEDAERRARPSVCGLVDRAMSPFDVSVQAIADVQEEVLRSPRNATRVLPPFRLYGLGRAVTLPYLPRHLYKILRDVLRNAARAALLKHARDGAPPGEISVVVADADDNSDVVVKVSDVAGGIPRSKLARIFSFSAASASYSTIASDLADQALCQALGPGALDGGAPDILDPRRAGQSLPLAKVYASLFNGDLKILSMEGHGTDCYVYISRIESDSVLPT